MEQPIFAGNPIAVGDILTDSADGPVVVIELFKTRISARLLGKDQRRVNYSFSGVQSRRPLRTLYWHDPVVIEPMKSRTDWETQRKFLTEINKVFADYLRSGKVIEQDLIEDDS